MSYNYPQAPDKKIQKLSNILVRYADQEGLEFSFGEQPVYALETFAFFGGISLFLIEAKETYEKLYNNLYTVEDLMQAMGGKSPQLKLDDIIKEEAYLDKQKEKLESEGNLKKFPIEFYEQEKDTYFGFIPRLNTDLPNDFTILAHLTHYSIEEYVKIYKKNKMLLIEGKIPLDPLYDRMVEKINARQIELLPASQIGLGLDSKNSTDLNSGKE